jgi:hypothetical protein
VIGGAVAGWRPPFERCHIVKGGSKCKPALDSPLPSEGWRHDKAILQAATMNQLHVPPQREPTLEAERILMVDVASTQARAKEVAPPASHEGSRSEATTAKPLSASPPLTTDGVDMMCHQLAGDSRHHHHVASGVCLLASVRLNSQPDLGQDRSTEAHRDTIHDKAGTITPYGFLIPGPAMVAGSAQ